MGPTNGNGATSRAWRPLLWPCPQLAEADIRLPERDSRFDQTGHRRSKFAVTRNAFLNVFAEICGRVDYLKGLAEEGPDGQQAVSHQLRSELDGIVKQ